MKDTLSIFIIEAWQIDFYGFHDPQYSIFDHIFLYANNLSLHNNFCCILWRHSDLNNICLAHLNPCCFDE